jgi:hypothetical protein
MGVYADQALLTGHMFVMSVPNVMDFHTLNPGENRKDLRCPVLS